MKNFSVPFCSAIHFWQTTTHSANKSMCSSWGTALINTCMIASVRDWHWWQVWAWQHMAQITQVQYIPYRSPTVFQEAQRNSHVLWTIYRTMAPAQWNNVHPANPIAGPVASRMPALQRRPKLGCSTGADYHWWTCTYGEQIRAAMTLETGFHIWPRQSCAQVELTVSTIFTFVCHLIWG